MHRRHLLTVTALSEGGIAVLLLLMPRVPIWLLLGLDQPSPEALSVSRIAGAGLMAFSVACWGGRDDHAAQSSLLLGVLIYDLAATGILAHAGWFVGLAGILLWPAVLLHAALAVWCGFSLRQDDEG